MKGSNYELETHKSAENLIYGLRLSGSNLGGPGLREGER